MLRSCVLCDKTMVAGRTVVQKGLAKKKGGTGRKTCRTTKRVFFANLQKMRIMLNGHPKRVYACTKCIKTGKLVKVK